MSFKASVLLFVALVAGAQALTINTPASIVECQPVQLSWSNGTAPYYLAVLPGGETTSTLENLPTQDTATSYTWTCDIPSGTSVTLRVTDSTGTIAYTDAVTIQAGSDSSCVGSSSSSSSGSASSTSRSSAAASASSSASSSSSKASSSVTATSSAAASSGTTSAAGSNNAATTSSSSTSGAVTNFLAAKVWTALSSLGVVASLIL